MNKVNKKAGIITGIILVTIFFSNIIYAGNSRMNGIYVEKVSVLNGNDIATNGDIVEITVKSEQEIEFIESQIYIGNAIISNVDIKYDDNGNGEYKVSYKIPDEIRTGDENEVFEGDNVKLGYSIIVKDAGGNETVLEAGEDYLITYYKSLRNSIFENSIEYDANLVNSIYDFESSADYVKDGDKLTITFKTKQQINVEEMTISGYKVDCTSNDDVEWKAELQIDKNMFENDNFNLECSCKITNSVGNEDSFTKHCAVYYAPINVENLNIESDNGISNAAKNGDKIKISFETGHPVNTTGSTLEMSKSIEIEFDEKIIDGKYKYTSEFEVKDDVEFYYKKIGANLILNDNVGNEKKVITQESDIIYYAPIKIDNLKIVSKNANSKLVKNGDIIEISFETKHRVQATVSSLYMSESEKIESDEENIKGIYKYTYKFEVGNDKKYDNKKISVELVVKDEVGNEPVEMSEESNITYYAPIEIENVIIESENVSDKFVKNGDIVEISFETKHKVQAEESILKMSKDIKIEDVNEETINSVYKYTIVFKVQDDEKYDSETISVNFIINDEAGNTTFNETLKSDITYYAPIKVKNIEIESKKYVKDGDIIKISFETQHKVDTAESTVEMSKSIKTEFTEKEIEGVYKYTYDFEVKNDEEYDNKKIGINLILKDKAHNKKEKSEKSNITYYAPIEIKDFKIQYKNKDEAFVKNGDKIQITFETSHPVKNNGSILKMSKDKGIQFTQVNIGGTYKYTSEFEVKNDTKYDDKKIIVSLYLRDYAGNYKKYENEESDITYYAPIKIMSLKMQTDNKNNKNLANKNDTITVSFCTTHKVNIKKSVIKFSKNYNMKIVKNGEMRNGRYIYKVSYEVMKDSSIDEQKIGFSVRVGDVAGNKTVTKNENDITNTVLYYKPVSKSVKHISFKSSNNHGTLAKKGDTLTFSFKSSHPVNVKGKIAGRNVKFISSDKGYNWIGSIKVTGKKLQDNKEIEYKIDISDKAGGKQSYKNGEGTKKIKYYAPISINELSMVNQEGSNLIAKNDDEVKVSFATTHPVKISDATIAGQKVDFIRDDKRDDTNIYWTASYKVREGDTANMAAIAMNFMVNDDAGNTAIKVTQEGIDNVIYYAPIEVSNLRISTDNAKDGNLYAKDGNTVTVEFNTNHKADMSIGTIAGHIAEISSEKLSDTNYKWRMDYTIKNGDIGDLSNVGFSFSLDDEAHNDSVSMDHNSTTMQNAITYYAPIMANTDYSSDYKDGTYVKNGDTITVNCRTSHPVKTTSASIAGRQATVQGNDTNALSMIYTIPENEGAIPEDGIKFEYTIEDIAGNELKVNQVSDTSVVKNIIYDRTLPVVNVSNDNTGGTSFYSDTAKYSLVYTGTNIFEDGMSCIINGVERIGDLKKYPTDDGYRVDIELDAEENYLIKASCIDLAGNKDSSDTSISVTVDKTNPILKIVNINTGYIFNSEFTLADYLDIEEKNLKDIDCMLTDNEGTHDWDINDVVIGDGKKTVTLKMTDMAGNVSDTYVYEFYVDVTAPSPVIMDKDSGYMFKQGKNSKKFAKNMSLNISLDEINVGKEPDKFTAIKVLDEDGNEYMDVIKSGRVEEDGSYSISIAKDGEYTLNVQAVDSVGNDTGLCKYSFMVGEKTWYIRFYENTPVFVTVVVCMSLLTVMGAAGFVIKKKGK